LSPVPGQAPEPNVVAPASSLSISIIEPAPAQATTPHDTSSVHMDSAPTASGLPLGSAAITSTAAGSLVPTSTVPTTHDMGSLISGPTPTTSTATPSATTASTTLVSVAAPPRTRLQDGIRKPKHYIDGIIQYAYSLNFGEPYNLQEALSNPQWKATMDDEYGALMRNKTWALVPP
jgi:hypothetical protein